MSLEGYRGHSAMVATPGRPGQALNVSMPQKDWSICRLWRNCTTFVTRKICQFTSFDFIGVLEQADIKSSMDGRARMAVF
jgi:hypothetical protein